MSIYNEYHYSLQHPNENECNHISIIIKSSMANNLVASDWPHINQGIERNVNGLYNSVIDVKLFLNYEWRLNKLFSECKHLLAKKLIICVNGKKGKNLIETH